jgi:hypothetical protein
MSQKPNVSKLVIPITVIHQAIPCEWITKGVDKKSANLRDLSTRFVGSKPEVPMVEWKKGIMLPGNPQLPNYFDGYAVREGFMELRNRVDCLEFLNRYGRFSQLREVDVHSGWTFNALMKWQEVFANLARLSLDRWPKYADSLMTPEHGPNIRAVLGALTWAENSIIFRPNDLGLRTVKGAKYIGAIRTEDVVSTIFTTLQIDHVRGAKFGVCARKDCPQFYEITSQHERKYCGPGCAHLETVRRLRKRQKAKSR